MMQYVIKLLITSALVVAASEAAKRSVVLGAIIASLPLTSFLAILWLYAETGDADKTAELAQNILWYVLPSLVFFVAFPIVVRAGAGFWPSLGLAIVLTVIAYLATAVILKRFGITI